MQKKPMIAWILFMILGVAHSGFCGPQNMDLNFQLPSPTNKVSYEYLGVEPDSFFSLDQVRAEILILEIFSMYCPVCQREAKRVNHLFDRIRKDKELASRVKLIGIGAGNSEFEVDFFKENYDVQFPLFSDSHFTIHKKIGQVRTPFFIGLKLKDNGFQVFFTHAGDIKNHERFLEKILSASGLDFNQVKKKDNDDS